VQSDTRAIALHAEIAPELLEVRSHGITFHLLVEILQRGRAHGRIADLEDPSDRPVGAEPAAALRNGAQRILQAEPQPGALSNLDVGEQAEHRSAPVRAPPGVRLIEPSVSCRRQATRHHPQLFHPHIFLAAVGGLNAGNTLDVGREPFREPCVIFTDVRQSEVHHLVHQHPVVAELRVGDVAPHLDANEATLVSVGRAPVHFVSSLRHELNPRRTGRKVPVVRGNDTGRAPDPFHQNGWSGRERRTVQLDSEIGATDGEGVAGIRSRALLRFRRRARRERAVQRRVERRYGNADCSERQHFSERRHGPAS